MSKPKHFLTGTEFNRGELLGLLQHAEDLRFERDAKPSRADLAGKTLLLLFDKPSLRTRVSFSVAMLELGGRIVESESATRKSEEPEDLIRVLGSYCHAVMARTHEHANLDRMAAKSSVPIVNGLSDSHHPCQALADILTLRQYYKSLDGLRLAYVGDGNNVLHSLLLLAPYLGIQLSYACPQGHEPSAFVVKKAKARAKEGGGSVQAFSDPKDAVKGANAIYADVWTSMGFERSAREDQERERAFDGFQVNEELHSHAAPGALIMHCMPMVRGKEITDGMVDHPNCSAIFRQSENRLHVQKAILLWLLA